MDISIFTSIILAECIALDQICPSVESYLKENSPIETISEIPKSEDEMSCNDPFEMTHISDASDNLPVSKPSMSFSAYKHGIFI